MCNKFLLLYMITTGSFTCLFAQNIGIGTDAPAQKLDVSGTTRSQTIIITSGGAVQDNLSKADASGTVGFKKGHRGYGMNYIICIQGIFPSQRAVQDRAVTGEGSFIGELKILAGNIVPKGWALCNGQLLNLAQNQQLYSLIGNTYGGTFPTNFAVPDLRAAAPVGQGTNSAGYTWTRAQKTD